ncbi:hypothetical protein DFH09DRAFT_1506488 [Mycena vulgaris]|nr:hypothetical protein DFH09DRAFT_1506488 [Mycena vulgaris]
MKKIRPYIPVEENGPGSTTVPKVGWEPAKSASQQVQAGRFLNGPRPPYRVSPFLSPARIPGRPRNPSLTNPGLDHAGAEVLLLRAVATPTPALLPVHLPIELGIILHRRLEQRCLPRSGLRWVSANAAPTYALLTRHSPLAARCSLLKYQMRARYTPPRTLFLFLHGLRLIMIMISSLRLRLPREDYSPGRVATRCHRHACTSLAHHRARRAYSAPATASYCARSRCHPPYVALPLAVVDPKHACSRNHHSRLPTDAHLATAYSGWNHSTLRPAAIDIRAPRRSPLLTRIVFHRRERGAGDGERGRRRRAPQAIPPRELIASGCRQTPVYSRRLPSHRHTCTLADGMRGVLPLVIHALRRAAAPPLSSTSTRPPLADVDRNHSAARPGRVLSLDRATSLRSPSCGRDARPACLPARERAPSGRSPSASLDRSADGAWSHARATRDEDPRAPRHVLQADPARRVGEGMGMGTGKEAVCIEGSGPHIAARFVFCVGGAEYFGWAALRLVMTTPPFVAGAAPAPTLGLASRCRSSVSALVPRSTSVGKVCFRFLSFSSLALVVVGVGVGVVGRTGVVIVVLAPAMTRARVLVALSLSDSRALPLRLSRSRPSSLPPRPGSPPFSHLALSPSLPTHSPPLPSSPFLLLTRTPAGPRLLRHRHRPHKRLPSPSSPPTPTYIIIGANGDSIYARQSPSSARPASPPLPTYKTTSACSIATRLRRRSAAGCGKGRRRRWGRGCERGGAGGAGC